jgi:hypothetical protein
LSDQFHQVALAIRPRMFARAAAPRGQDTEKGKSRMTEAIRELDAAELLVVG